MALGQLGQAVRGALRVLAAVAGLRAAKTTISPVSTSAPAPTSESTACSPAPAAPRELLHRRHTALRNRYTVRTASEERLAVWSGSGLTHRLPFSSELPIKTSSHLRLIRPALGRRPHPIQTAHSASLQTARKCFRRDWARPLSLLNTPGKGHGCAHYFSGPV